MCDVWYLSVYCSVVAKVGPRARVSLNPALVLGDVFILFALQFSQLRKWDNNGVYP